MMGESKVGGMASPQGMEVWPAPRDEVRGWTRVRRCGLYQGSGVSRRGVAS